MAAPPLVWKEMEKAAVKLAKEVGEWVEEEQAFECATVMYGLMGGWVIEEGFPVAAPPLVWKAMEKAAVKLAKEVNPPTIIDSFIHSFHSLIHSSTHPPTHLGRLRQCGYGGVPLHQRRPVFLLPGAQPPPARSVVKPPTHPPTSSPSSPPKIDYPYLHPPV